MTRRSGQGWQVMLADLSLILFITTASSLVAAEDPAPKSEARTAALVETDAPPAGVFRAGDGASLTDWLATRGTDPREQLTIMAHYRASGRSAALTRAGALASEAEAAGQPARIVVERGDRDEVLALFAFTNVSAVAQDLRERGETPAD